MKCHLFFCFFYRLPLYQALFTSFRQCLIERQVPVLLPGLMIKGQAQLQVTLYQHVCVRLCASVAALPPVCFPVLVSSTHLSFFQLNLNKFFLLISIFTCRLKSPTGLRSVSYISIVRSVTRTMYMYGHVSCMFMQRVA